MSKPKKVKVPKVFKWKRIPKFFKWNVEIKIHKTWIADGFNLSKERVHSMVAQSIGGAYNNEIQTRILSKPAKSLIKKVQGY